jgi:homoaconitase/3-isopropylmalate dehydratase large subunit
MGKNLVEKILAQHLISGNLVPGEEIGIRIDQTLTQDATGTMAYLQFEAMNVPKVKTELSVSYIDHNTIQIGFENADDHRYLAECGAKIRHCFFPRGKRHLPSGSSGKIRQTGKNSYRLGQSHSYLRSAIYDCYRRGRP